MNSSKDYSFLGTPMDEVEKTNLPKKSIQKTGKDYSFLGTPLDETDKNESYNPKENLEQLKQYKEVTPLDYLKATGRGAANIIEGPKQLFLEAFGKPGEAEKYTKQIEAERQAFGETTAGKNPITKAFTSLTELLPLAAIPGGVTGGLAKRMATGGAGFGAYEGTSFVPEGDSRLAKTATGVVSGAVLPAIIPAAKATKQALLGKKDPALIAETLASESRISDIENQLPKLGQKSSDALKRQELSAQESDIAKQELEQSRESARTNINVASQEPKTIQLKLNQQEEKLSNINQKNKDLEEKLSGLQDIKPFESDMTHWEEADEASKARELAEKGISQAEAHQLEAENFVSNADTEISRHLNEGADYPVRIQRSLQPELKSIEKHWSDRYKNVFNEIKNNDFKLTNSDRVPRLMQVVEDAKLRYGNDPTGEFAQLMRKAPNAKDISASDFMAKQKDFRDYRSNLLRRMREEPSAVKRDELSKAYNDSREINDLIDETLMEGLGPFRSDYSEVMNGYRTQIYPLRENPTANKIKEGKRLSGNVAEQLSGHDTGQELLRSIALRNPEVRRNVIGQEFAHKPHELSNMGELHREYFNLEPELQRQVNIRERLAEAKESAKSNVAQAKEHHGNTKKIESEKHRLAKQREDEIKTLKKESQNKVKELEAERKNLKSSIIKNENRIKEIKKKEPDMKKSLVELKEKSKKANVTLQQHKKDMNNYERAKKEYDLLSKEKMNLEKSLDKNKDKLVNNMSLLKKAYYAAKGLYKIGKKLKGLG